MTRWMEEFELKHVEMMRCIKSFSHICEVWKTLAHTSKNGGHAAYARRQSAIYFELHENAKALLAANGYENLRDMEESTLVEIIQRFRKEEMDWLRSFTHNNTPDKLYPAGSVRT